jgi:epoxyqueuosine reductase
VTAPVAIPAADLAAALAPLCRQVGIDLAGAAPLEGPAPHAQAWRDWLDRGRDGDLPYLQRTREDRADPRRRNPWARSLLVFAQRYTTGWPAAGDPEPPPPGDWLPHVSRYARGADYHDVLLRGIRTVLQGLRERWPGLRAHPAVDTGPYLERDWAAAAGLGFLGKNTCLIHETLGSGLVLGIAPTNLELDDPGAAPRPLYAVARRPAAGPGADRCGSCTRCLDACPTAAFPAPRVLDANRCLSTWTIEWRGQAPADERHRQGDRLFGCDICQQVCPWNRRARRAAATLPPPRQEYAPSPDHAALTLADLLAVDAPAFRARLRRTPLWRSHPEGLRRNALVVAANTGRRDLAAAIAARARTDPDPQVRAVAAWAAARLAPEPEEDPP